MNTWSKWGRIDQTEYELTEELVRIDQMSMNWPNRWVRVGWEPFNIQIMLFIDISLHFLSQFLKLRPEFTTASLFRFRMGFIPFSIFLLVSDIIQGTEATDMSICLRKDVLIYSLLYDGSYQINVFLVRTRTKTTIEIFILCKIWRT